MHRAHLLALLSQYFSVSNDETKNKEVIIKFVKDYPHCFDRSLEIGHVTASCWLVNKENTKALLMHHKKLNKWVQLGGHCDGNSDVLAVSLKEAQEESGIENIVPMSDKIFDLDVHISPKNHKEEKHVHYDIRFLLQVVSNEEIVQNHESNALMWVSKNKKELPTTQRSIIRMFEKWVTFGKN